MFSDTQGKLVVLPNVFASNKDAMAPSVTDAAFKVVYNGAPPPASRGRVDILKSLQDAGPLLIAADHTLVRMLRILNLVVSHDRSAAHPDVQ